MKRLFCLILVCVLLTSCASMPSRTVTSSLERLGRGMYVIKADEGMFISWRYLAADTPDTVFELYRDNSLIYTSSSGDATCFLDAEGTTESSYTLVYGSETVIPTVTSEHDYIDIPLSKPADNYTPNDCSVGDVDGDGEYEIFLKWQPDNAKDNSQKGITDNTIIDCIRLDGTLLWRIDLGINIRSGAHYTQFLVADFDGDGRAEMTCKTSDGTVDGLGNVIGSPDADFRNDQGQILWGGEYYTLFDGLTGEALDSVPYKPERGDVNSWGDNYGNRSERYLGAVCYFGDNPSAVTVRGYYTRMTAVAYDVVDKKLVERWYFNAPFESDDGYGDGYHNCMPADVDGDGRQELFLGGVCLDDNGEVLWCTNQGHGDALHIGDFLPDRAGLEAWICHENPPYGLSLLDAATGKTIFRIENDDDTGRACAGNILASNKGAEFWGMGSVYNGKGKTLDLKRPGVNFVIYWDGDLEREILDSSSDSPLGVYKPNSDGDFDRIKTTKGHLSNNSTKATPNLSGDILGDWREEIIARSSDGNSLRIYMTDIPTEYRIVTLMHDLQYRAQVAGQNVAYNQPPHTSYYLGSDRQLPAYIQ